MNNRWLFTWAKRQGNRARNRVGQPSRGRHGNYLLLLVFGAPHLLCHIVGKRHNLAKSLLKGNVRWARRRRWLWRSWNISRRGIIGWIAWLDIGGGRVIGASRHIVGRWRPCLRWRIILGRSQGNHVWRDAVVGHNGLLGLSSPCGLTAIARLARRDGLRCARLRCARHGWRR